MKLAIIGSRGITDINIKDYIDKIDNSDEITEIISGGAKGIDTLAEEYADKLKLSKHIIRPRYKKFGKAATIHRNKDIINSADIVLVFWDNCSKGTKSSIDYMIKNNINHIVYYF